MTLVRRAADLFFRFDEGEPLTVELLLRRRLEVGPRTRIRAISALTRRETVLTLADLEALLAISEREWTDASEHDDPLIGAFAERGLVVTDEDDDVRRALRRRNEVAARLWQPYAALFHAQTSWRDVTVDTYAELGEQTSDEDVERLLEDVGPPPPHFFEVAGAHAVHPLPQTPSEGPLHEVLGARRTTRAFDVDAALAEDDLATLLHQVFGCHGTVPLHGSHLALKRTSPSGGALHPIEVYPLVRAVAGVEPGLYHYRTRDHALELILPLDHREARSLAELFMCGQTFFARAQAQFVLTARFDRSFWKYRRHDRAYAALLIEAGHFSQTLYLVAADLGLGAFVTAAINGANIEERLGLEPLAEGPIAICGCGVAARGPSDLEPPFEPYAPRRP